MNYQWRDLVGSLVDGKYPLIEYLGDVAGNGVYATNPVDARQAIIRLMSAGTEEANITLEQWRDATALSHPHIAGTYAAGETEVIGNTVVYTVTERPDDSLAEAVRNRPLNEDEARQLSEAVLGGLSYLHQKGFAHGALAPENIVAMGDTIKLAPWTIGRATPKQRSEDMFAAGQTIAEVLTQKRPTGDATMPRLPQPFADVARACVRRTVEADEALRMLTAAPDVEPPVVKKYKLPTAAIVVASLAVLALVFGVRSYKSSANTSLSRVTTAEQPRAGLPSPVQETVRQRTEAASAPVTPAPQAGRGNWVVVAEIYKQHDQAMQHARQLAARWRDWRPEVYPPEPNGRRFMVVLGFSETRKEAEQLLARARAAGMPRKVYLTRINR
ncbi:MAG TPA: hypothetical protein VER03_20005 [Bryobacteraceae bacterium]|nr:hypothetical protein [Bryobacteraceae bacterium]